MSALYSLREAVTLYGHALRLLTPLWSGIPQHPTHLADRIAIRLSESSALTYALLGCVLRRAPHNNTAEHSLKVAIVTNALAHFLSLPQQERHDVVRAALLHHLGQDNRALYYARV